MPIRTVDAIPSLARLAAIGIALLKAILRSSMLGNDWAAVTDQ